MTVHIVLYLLIAASLIWGRLRFFKVDSGTTTLTAVVYDLAVGGQLITTVYYMLNVIQFTQWVAVIAAVMYLLSLGLFWWSVVTARSLDFAFSGRAGSIVTTGPFRIVRHPFYTSYSLVWIASTVLFDSPVLWITLLYLMAFYYLSARKEEKVILESGNAKAYEAYQQDVGMFLPRIKRWKRSHSRH